MVDLEYIRTINRSGFNLLPIIIKNPEYLNKPMFWLKGIFIQVCLLVISEILKLRP
jgi:hypothetical protein